MALSSMCLWFLRVSDTANAMRSSCWRLALCAVASRTAPADSFPRGWRNGGAEKHSCQWTCQLHQFSPAFITPHTGTRSFSRKRAQGRSRMKPPKNKKESHENVVKATSAESFSEEDAGGLSSLTVREVTMNWVRRVVVGLSLCPFADKPLSEGKIEVIVVRGDDEETILNAVLQCMLERADNPGTSLVVTPDFASDDFQTYLSLISVLESGVLPDYELDGRVQIAPFHPNFQFDGISDDSIENWTNRSPYPIFHILREAEVSRAVSLFKGDSSQVWQRNIDLMGNLETTLGRVEADKTLRDMQTRQQDEVQGEKEVIEELLERHPSFQPNKRKAKIQEGKITEKENE